MVRSRSNGITGTDIRLNTYYYKDGELQSPSSIRKVEILNNRESIVSSYLESDISSIAEGIKRLQINIPNTWSKGSYFDKWYYIPESGLDSSIHSNEFIVREAEWEQRMNLSAANYSLYAELESERVALYDKKYIKFKVNDATNNLKSIDNATIYFKDYDGSNLYVEASTVTDEQIVYYYFNSSHLQASYPDYINRESLYSWVLQVEYRGETFRLNPISFKFAT